MVLLLVLKRFELKSGRVIGGSLRPKVGEAAHNVLTWVEYRAPALAESVTRRTYRYVRSHLHRATAVGIVVAERGLERMLRGLRQNTGVTDTNKNASEFLREVAAHKKQIVKSAKKRAIYEE
jgi:hypothetical protein